MASEKIVKPTKLINVVKQVRQRNTARLVPTVVGKLDGVTKVGNVINMPEGRTKICQGECGKRRPIGEFFFRAKGSPVRSSRCRYCAALAQKAWRTRKKEAAKKGKRGR